MADKRISQLPGLTAGTLKDEALYAVAQDGITWNVSQDSLGIVAREGTFSSVKFEETELTWDPDYGTLDIDMGFDGVIQKIGLDTYYRIKNQSGATINKGDLVQFDGSIGASGILRGRRSTTLINQFPEYLMGVATMTIPNGEDGYVTHFGTIRGLNTTGSAVGQTWVEGDILYYNPAVVGGLTKVEPAAPNAKIVVAAVVRVNANSGILFVRPTIHGALKDLSDVFTYDPATLAIDSFLYWSGNQWLTDATIKSQISSKIVKYNNTSYSGSSPVPVGSTSGYVSFTDSVDPSTSLVLELKTLHSVDNAMWCDLVSYTGSSKLILSSYQSPTNLVYLNLINLDPVNRANDIVIKFIDLSA